MSWFIFAVIVWLAAIVLALAAVLAKAGQKIGPAVLAGVALFAGFGLFALAGLKSVPVKNLGIPQTFGHVGAVSYTPGAHETWTPWLHLTDIDETVQTTTFEGRNCLDVRIGGQQTACADLTIQWQVRPSAASKLFSQYANHGDLMTTIEDALVIRELKQVANQTLGDYNPIADQQALASNSTVPSQFSGFGPQILTAMRADIGADVDVRTILFPLIRYDAQTQSKLNAIQQAYANDAIAKENFNVNRDQAKAYAELGNPSMAALISECLNKQNLPAGFQCFPGAGINVNQH